MQTASAALPPPPIHLNERELGFYAGVLMSVAPAARQQESVRAIAATVAQAMEEIELCSAIIAKEGMTVPGATGGTRAHPAIQIRADATKRVGALCSRIKALPNLDSREAARAVRFEQPFKTQPIVAASEKDAPTTDWVKRLKEEVGHG